MRSLVVVISLFILNSVFANNRDVVVENIYKVFDEFELDPALKSASWGFCLIDNNTGSIIASKDPEKSLIPASTMKCVTTASAMLLMEDSFQFRTILSHTGEIKEGVLNGNLILKGYGDPTFGSIRFIGGNGLDPICKEIVNAISDYGITGIKGKIVVDDTYLQPLLLPDSWLWSDIGNYYGVAANAFNINENRYFITFSSGKPGELASVKKIDPIIDELRIDNYVTAGDRGSGDNAYVFNAPNSAQVVLRGTVPPYQSSFTIKASIPNPASFFQDYLYEYIIESGMNVYSDRLDVTGITEIKIFKSPDLKEIATYTNQHSINVYAEAIMKQLGVNSKGQNEIEIAAKRITKFWTEKGIDLSSFQMKDGSGLSRLNFVSTLQLASILKETYHSPSYKEFKETLAVAGRVGTLRSIGGGTAAEGRIYGKSGTMNGVKSYCGFVDGRSDGSYSFAVISNYFTGSTAAMKNKISKLFNEMGKLP